MKTMFKLGEKLENDVKMTKTSVDNDVGPLCHLESGVMLLHFQFLQYASDEWTHVHVDRMDSASTALAKLPSKVQVSLIVCVIL